MATTPTPSKPAQHQQPSHPSTHHQPSPTPNPAHQPAPRETRAEAHKHEPEALPIGAKPKDPHDPQAAKFEPHAAPPRWDDPKKDPRAREEWTPEPSLDAREQKPPEGYYADGMTIADEQRARAAWVEAHGVAEYKDEVDQRPDDEELPQYDPHALAGGGAFVTAGTQRQVPGVTPPTKRE